MVPNRERNRNDVERHCQPEDRRHKVDTMTGAALGNTSSVGSGHAGQPLDGWLQPERFDSSVLRLGRPANMGFLAQAVTVTLDMPSRWRLTYSCLASVLELSGTIEFFQAPQLRGFSIAKELVPSEGCFVQPFRCANSFILTPPAGVDQNVLPQMRFPAAHSIHPDKANN